LRALLNDMRLIISVGSAPSIPSIPDLFSSGEIQKCLVDVYRMA
jgi:hypothetical protein